MNDLTKDDFSVKVDGKTVPIDYFTRIEAGQLVGPDLANASPDLILESYRASTGDRYLARQFLLFFDDEHLMPFDVPRAVEGLRDLVTRLSPSDQMAHLLLQPGQDGRPHSVHELEGGAPRRPLTPREDPAERAELGRRTSSSTGETRPRLGRRGAAARPSGTGRRSRMAARRRCSTTSGAPCRRSPRAPESGSSSTSRAAFELRPGQSFAQAVSVGRLQQFDYTVVPEFGRTVREANAAGITIYAVDARGLTVDVDAGESAVIPVNRFFTDANRREELAGFADETGGQIFENRNSFKGAVDQIYRESSSFYSIGVTLSSLPKKKDSTRSRCRRRARA